MEKMSKLLKMEFRRLFKSFYFYAFPATVLIILVIEKLTFDGTKMDSIGISKVFSYGQEMITFAMVAAGIMAIYHWSQENKKGFIKNIAGSVGGKHKITIARMVIGAFVMTVYGVCSFLFGLFYTLINYKGIEVIGINPYPATAEELPERFRSSWISSEQWRSQQIEYLWRNIAEFLLLILAGIATIALALMLFEIFRSAALSYVTVMMIGFNILEPLIINLVALINSKLEIARHLIIYQFVYINGDFTGEDMAAAGPAPLWTFWLRTGLYVAVFLVTAIVVSRKKDTV